MLVKPFIKMNSDNLLPSLGVSVIIHIIALILFSGAYLLKEDVTRLIRFIPVDIIELQHPDSAGEGLPWRPKVYPGKKKADTRSYKLKDVVPPRKETIEVKEAQKSQRAIKQDGMGEKILEESHLDDIKSETVTLEKKPPDLFPTEKMLAELSQEYDSSQLKTTPDLPTVSGFTKGINRYNIGRKLDFTVDLDYLPQEALLDYMDNVKRKIELLWWYPEAAAWNGQQGRLKIVFTIEKNGAIEVMKLTKGSGYPILDNAALDAVRLANPFNPVPKKLGEEAIHINANFEYILRTIYRSPG